MWRAPATSRSCWRGSCPGVIVLTSPDRYLAGRLAEHQLGATVHVLDDGFQHFQLDRDIDVVLVSARRTWHGATFPAGRLREPPDALVAADARRARAGDGDAGARLRTARSSARAGSTAHRSSMAPSRRSRSVFAVAGIADPQPFFVGARERRAASSPDAPCSATTIRIPSRTCRRIFADARASRRGAIMTTEKDYVRLLRYRPFPMPVGWLPLTMEPEPLADFQRWLASSMASARDIVIG